MYNNKYLKYKNKYLNLQKQIGGTNHTWVGRWALDKQTYGRGNWEGTIDNIDKPEHWLGSIIPDHKNILLIGSVFDKDTHSGNFMEMVKNMQL